MGGVWDARACRGHGDAGRRRRHRGHAGVISCQRCDVRGAVARRPGRTAPSSMGFRGGVVGLALLIAMAVTFGQERSGESPSDPPPPEPVQAPGWLVGRKEEPGHRGGMRRQPVGWDHDLLVGRRRIRNDDACHRGMCQPPRTSALPGPDLHDHYWQGCTQPCSGRSESTRRPGSSPASPKSSMTRISPVLTWAVCWTSGPACSWSSTMSGKTSNWPPSSAAAASRALGHHTRPLPASFRRQGHRSR